jgi:hypothetical protein
LTQASSSSKLALIVIEKVKMMASAAGATTHAAAAAAVAADCVAHQLAAGCAARGALSLVGVKLGLAVWPTNLLPVVLWGCLDIGRSEAWFAGGQAHASKKVVFMLQA